MTPRIQLRGLTRRLPSADRQLTIVDRIDLSIAPGEFVAVLGPSGSGKSTLLALMAGLDRPSEGQVILDGREVQDLSEDDLALLRRRTIGFVFQSFQLLGNLTALENVLLPLELADVSEARSRADLLLSTVGLGERGHHYPSQLSGGEQQRVAVARAFAADPSVLFADEPTGNLDSATGEEIISLMFELNHVARTTLLLVTHDEVLAQRCPRRIGLAAGRLTNDERR